jgi:4-hydroxy-2-oxoheptanedioate aldolase
MIRAAHAVGISPFVRIPPGEERLIELVLHMGALGIQISRVASRADVEAAVRATKVPPIGDRHASTSLFTAGMGQMSNQEHLDWASENIMLSVQVETRKGIEAIDEIVGAGLDMVQSGNETFHIITAFQGSSIIRSGSGTKMISAAKRQRKWCRCEFIN